jgi:outer membrane protein OmpA-like peptidoglycan-associated protein
MKNLKIVTLISILALSSLMSKGQEQNNKALFNKGNDLMMKGFENIGNTRLEDILDKSNGHIKNPSITEASAIWKKFLDKDPNNADANFKLGLCYIISSNEKAKALPFFLLAIQNMSPSHYSFRNNNGMAPAFALYFLAEAFIENNQPDSALKYFALYNDQYQVPPMSADREIFMCINAKNSLKMPRKLKAVNLSSLNTGYSETNPVVKSDNSMIFFSSRRPSKSDTGIAGSENSEDIYYASKTSSGEWGTPVPFQYNTNLDEAPLCISADGQTLYFRRYKNFNDDIYFSKFKDGVWNKPQPFKELNSRSNETGLTFSGDGKTLYFSSDRPGGLGGYDIYNCILNEKGKWSAPENLGSQVNSSLNEIDPNLDEDGKTLYFSSDGKSASGMGGQDIYYTQFQSASNKWSDPQNLGYPVNTTRDDINFYKAGEGKRYYSRINEEKNYDLFEIVAADPDSVASIPSAEVAWQKERLKILMADSAAYSAIVEKTIETAYLGQDGSFSNILFDFDKSDIKDGGEKELAKVLAYMQDNMNSKIEIAGYTDSKGSDFYNLNLSARRVDRVVNFLVKQGISKQRLISIAKGKGYPVMPNENPDNSDNQEGRRLNRRVELCSKGTLINDGLVGNKQLSDMSGLISLK